MNPDPVDESQHWQAIWTIMKDYRQLFGSENAARFAKHLVASLTDAVERYEREAQKARAMDQ
jgi:hypothetical protein